MPGGGRSFANCDRLEKQLREHGGGEESNERQWCDPVSCCRERDRDRGQGEPAEERRVAKRGPLGADVNYRERYSECRDSSGQRPASPGAEAGLRRLGHRESGALAEGGDAGEEGEMGVHEDQAEPAPPDHRCVREVEVNPPDAQCDREAGSATIEDWAVN